MDIKLGKFGKILMSRPAGRESFLEFSNSLESVPKEITLDFSDVSVVAPSWLDEFLNLCKKAGIKFNFKESKNPSVLKSLKVIADLEAEKIHPWRLCEKGSYWVGPFSRIRLGKMEHVVGHCRLNSRGHDVLHASEIKMISNSFEGRGREILKPDSNSLSYAYGNDFDVYIGGWTKYWNEVLKSEPPLEPNFVKALIATESGFDPKSKSSLGALGLLQLLPTTLRILGDQNGEISDHFLEVNSNQAKDPAVNICAGIRWLHHKRKLFLKQSKMTSSKSKWIDVIPFYKGYVSKKGVTLKGAKETQRFLRIYEKLGKY